MGVALWTALWAAILALAGAYQVPLFHKSIPRRAGLEAEEHEPIVILHGLLGSSRNFQSWAAMLHEKLGGKHEVVCCDLRNHGKSAALGELEMNYESMASDLMATMQTLGFKRAHLVGHSMGGKVAAAAALLHGQSMGHGRGEIFPSLTMMDISPIAYTAEEFLGVTSTVSSLKRIDETFAKFNCKDTLHQQIEDAFPDPSLRTFVSSNMQLSESTLTWSFHLGEIYKSLDHIAGFAYAFDAGAGTGAGTGTSAATGADDSTSSTSSTPMPMPTPVTPVTPFHNPTLVLKGSDSSFVRSSHMGRLASLFPLYNLASVRGAGEYNTPFTSACFIHTYMCTYYISTPPATPAPAPARVSPLPALVSLITNPSFPLFPSFPSHSHTFLGHWVHFDKPQESADRVAAFVQAAEGFHRETEAGAIEASGVAVGVSVDVGVGAVSVSASA
jgi:pimeloyl-ACP methyl ester carboxylesterase